MAAIVMQRDLVISLKKETILNVSILSKLQPMSAELSRCIFKENAMEKPTQILFNHLSYYLLSVIDVNLLATVTWPLYDTKDERAFRNELASFIKDYSSKGLLTPVMSSYLVNPGCFKVTVLIFQLSQLAVNRLLMRKMKKENQKQLHTEMTEKYKAHQKEGFMECIEKETQIMHNKFSNYLYKRKIMEKIAAMFRKKIKEMETTLTTSNAQNYINKLVDGFMKLHNVDDETKSELEKVKNVNEQPIIFDLWLSQADVTIDSLEKSWDSKISSLLRSCQTLLQSTEALISKHMGESERSAYMVEYNHKTDEICTKELQCQVNSEQKYVLRNLVKDGQLNFPNLVRAFVISVCFILKQNEVGLEIYNFNEYLDGARAQYSEMVLAMRVLIERMLNADAKLQPTTITYNSLLSVKDLPEIPPLPDLSNLKATRDASQVLFNTFTPLNSTRYQFNLRKKASATLFAKPQLRSLITPFHPAPRDNFLKNLISCRSTSYDRQISSEDHNMSIIPHENRANETIAECSSGFTKQQILRLLSTKKTSSSKKHKFSTERPNIKIKKGGLFNETSSSNESIGLFRSYSSPNLYENKENRSHFKARCRKLSIMQEDSQSPILEVSGIEDLNKQVSYSTSQEFGSAESSRKVVDTSTNPVTGITSSAEDRIHNILNMKWDLDKEMGMNGIILSPIENSSIVNEHVEKREQCEIRNETPKTNTQLIRKTSSLEKIINRFKKVRATVLPEKKDDSAEFRTIAEEKPNMKGVNFDVFTANRILLPDLLSPNCSNMAVKSNVNNYLDEICLEMDEVESRKPRQSLGTALGVDQTFLDQFDLID